MSQVDDAYFFAEPLSPDDRLRLIARLWASLPPEHWAAPSPAELAEVERRLAKHAAGQNADVPWDIVNRMLINHEAVKRGRIYSAPRRFDLATILIVTAAFALILGAMASFNFPAIASGYVAAFITCVGIGQAVLFGGRRPRLASVLTGMATYFACVISLSYASREFGSLEFPGGFPGLVLFALVSSATYGSILGYVAGVLVGGVFLVAEVLRSKLGIGTGDASTFATVHSATPSPDSPADTPPAPPS